MKTVKMQGGPGNQLFCLALAHSVGALSGARVALDVSGYAADTYGRSYLLRPLAERMGFVESAAAPILGHRLTGALTRLARPRRHVVERDPPSDLEGLRRLVEQGDTFDGYWQDEAYMAEPRRFAVLVRGFLAGLAPAPPSRDIVLHFRTYKDEHRPSRRGVPGAAWFERAVQQIEDQEGRATEIVLVSDDPALARSGLGRLGERVRAAPPEGPFADLALLIAARSLVLCNSSFSWWGGFCSQARRILYPGRSGLYHYPAPARRFTVL